MNVKKFQREDKKRIGKLGMRREVELERMQRNEKRKRKIRNVMHEHK